MWHRHVTCTLCWPGAAHAATTLLTALLPGCSAAGGSSLLPPDPAAAAAASLPYTGTGRGHAVFSWQAWLGNPALPMLFVVGKHMFGPMAAAAQPPHCAAYRPGLGELESVLPLIPHLRRAHWERCMAAMCTAVELSGGCGGGRVGMTHVYLHCGGLTAAMRRGCLHSPVPQPDTSLRHLPPSRLQSSRCTRPRRTACWRSTCWTCRCPPAVRHQATLTRGPPLLLACAAAPHIALYHTTRVASSSPD